jgi:hypothetical protein
LVSRSILLSFGERLMSRGIWQTAEGLLGLDPLEL